MHRRGTLKRYVIASLAAVSFLAGTGAQAGPEDEVRSLLLRAENVFAAGISPTQVFLSWDDPSIAPENGYRIEWAADEAGPYVTLTTIGGCTSPPSVTTAPPGIRAGTCVTSVQPPITPSDPTPRFYRVVPLFGTPSVQNGPQGTVILEGAPSEPDPAILGAPRPTNLRCNGGLACLQVQSIELTWQDNSDEAEFWIMRARGVVNPQFGILPHSVVPANVTVYNEIIPEFNQSFFYKVVAVRRLPIPRLDGSVTPEESYSDSTSPDRIKVETPPIPPPADPFGLNATFIPPSTAKLTWTDVATNENGFFVEWGPTATGFETMDPRSPNPGVGPVEWVDTQLPPDTSRCYRVRAWRLGPAYSGYTNTACLGSTPIAPTGLIANAVSNAQVNLSWNDNSNAEDSYIVERCTGVCGPTASGWAQLAATAADVDSFSDTTVVGQTTYSYRVFASNASGRSPSSNIATATTLKAPLPAPTNLSATPKGSHRIELSWIDNATVETGFRIEYRNSMGQWETLAHRGSRTGTGTTTYLDRESLPANHERCYRVRAVKGTVEVSDPSNEACATTFAPQIPNGVPSNVVVSPGSIKHRSLTLQWTDTATNEDSFRVEVIRFPNEHCGQNITGLPWATIATAPAVEPTTGTTSITLTNLQPHTAHHFRVIAVNLDGESAPSVPAACAQTDGPPKPTFLDPNANGDVEVTRCRVRLRTPIMEGPDVETNKMRLRVAASVPGGQPFHISTLWLNGTYGVQQDGRVVSENGEDIWEFHFQFRKGISYGLLAAGFGPAPNQYEGDESRLRDITVLADCPQSGL